MDFNFEDNLYTNARKAMQEAQRIYTRYGCT